MATKLIVASWVFISKNVQGMFIIGLYLYDIIEFIETCKFVLYMITGV